MTDRAIVPAGAGSVVITDARREALRPAFLALGRQYAWYVKRVGVEHMREQNRLTALMLGEFDATLILCSVLEWIARGNRLYPGAGELRQVCLRIRAAITEEAHQSMPNTRFVDLARKTDADAQKLFERDLLPATREYVEATRAQMNAQSAAAAAAQLEQQRAWRDARGQAEASTDAQFEIRWARLVHALRDELGARYWDQLETVRVVSRVRHADGAQVITISMSGRRADVESVLQALNRRVAGASIVLAPEVEVS